MCYETTAVITCQLKNLMQSVVKKQDNMPDGQMQYPTQWIWQRDVRPDIPLPYPPNGILRFCPSAILKVQSE